MTDAETGNRRIDVTELSGRAYATGMTGLPYAVINALAEAIQDASQHGVVTCLEIEGQPAVEISRRSSP